MAGLGTTGAGLRRTANPPDFAPPSILFLVTEDWFARSHFLPLIERAHADGWRVTVACRIANDAQVLRAAGARVEPFDFARGAAHHFPSVAQRLSQLLHDERPDVVHAIALQPILTLCLAQAAAPQAGLILALTGLGFLSTAESIAARAVRRAAATVIAGAVRRKRAVLLVENQDDARAIAQAGGRLPDEAIVQLPGAGVDPVFMGSTPPPPAPPIRVGVVARLVRSKGVDVAVAAVKRLRSRGMAIELHIAGSVDPLNPGAVSQAEAAEWGTTPCIVLHGHVADIGGFWAQQHIACLPSRGGEGLPRSLLEAAAAGRPIVTTNVPGCRDFVRDGLDGRIVPVGDVDALASALGVLAESEADRMTMGESARQRIVDGFTIKHVQDLAASAWAKALDLPRRANRT